jgi:hypothetical protein
MAGFTAYSGLRVIGQPVKWIAVDIRRIYIKGRILVQRREEGVKEYFKGK